MDTKKWKQFLNKSVELIFMSAMLCATNILKTVAGVLDLKNSLWVLFLQ